MATFREGEPPRSGGGGRSASPRGSKLRLERVARKEDRGRARPATSRRVVAAGALEPEGLTVIEALALQGMPGGRIACDPGRNA